MIHGREANCRFCAHYTGGQACQAFPAGIPGPLWTGDNTHHEPYPGDNGIRYAPKLIEVPDAEIFLHWMEGGDNEAEHTNQP